MTSQTPVTVAYAPAQSEQAHALAATLQAAGLTLVAQPTRGGAVVALLAPGALEDDTALNQTILDALDASVPLVLAQAAPTPLPRLIDHLQPVPLEADGQAVLRAVHAVTQPGAVQQPRVLTPRQRARNTRWLWAVGGFALLWFAFALYAIIVFDIESPQAQYDANNTQVAATVGAFAQPFVPRSTEQALALPATLDQLGDDLAGVVAATATQVARDGGRFTPIPTGLMVGTPAMSVVRQTATGQAEDTINLGQSQIIATATAAAATSDAALAQQLLTVTAAAVSPTPTPAPS